MTTTVGTQQTPRRFSPGARIASTVGVAADVGVGRGALVIYPAERYRGTQIQISPVEGDGPRIHARVRERVTHDGSALTASFGGLPAGGYIVWADAATIGTTVTVSEATVTELFLS